MISVSDMVSREVHYCVSAMVSTIARSCGELHATADLSQAAEQAMELCSPLADYEEGAREAGWVEEVGQWSFKTDDGETIRAVSAEDACQILDIDPYAFNREVFEHWIVSDWLAEKLAAKGEKVDSDFMGLTVWARTTTGQGIASDSVIEAIHADLIAR